MAKYYTIIHGIEHVNFMERLDDEIAKDPNILLGIRCQRNRKNSLLIHKDDVNVVLKRFTDVVMKYMKEILK